MNTLLHPHTKSQIELFIAAPAHSLGLSGEQGAGKSHAARYIAGALLGIPIKKVTNHPYVKALDMSQGAGIEAVRGTQSFLKLRVPGTQPIRRVVILDNIDALGHEAQNALLKTLEEPPLDTVIIVTLSMHSRILPTIHSRLQTIEVLPISYGTALKNATDQKTAQRAYHMSGGMAGLYAALVENQTDHTLVAAIDEARRIIAMSRYQRLTQVDKLAKNDAPSPSQLLDGLYRLVEAGYKQSVKTKSNDELKNLAARMQLIEKAISDLNENVQAKLVLSRLFLQF